MLPETPSVDTPSSSRLDSLARDLIDLATKTLRGRLLHIAPLLTTLACTGTGLDGKADLATSGYCGVARAETTTWPDNLSLEEGNGIVALQPAVAEGSLQVDSNGSWLLEIPFYPDAEFDSGFNFNAEFDPKKDVRDATDASGVRTVTLKTVIPFEYDGDTYRKDATFVLVSPDEGATLRVTMKDSPIIGGEFEIDLRVAAMPEHGDTGDTAAESSTAPSLLEVCEAQFAAGR